MSEISEKELIESVLNWVGELYLNNGHRRDIISENTDLLAEGILDSFGFLDLVLFIEGQTGRRLDLRDVEPDQFCVVKSLCTIALNHQDKTSPRA